MCILLDFLNSLKSSLQECESQLISVEIPTAGYLLLVMSYYNGAISLKSHKLSCSKIA